MRTYDIQLVKEGEPIMVSLRLTLGAQLALKKKYNENALSTIFGAIDDPEKMAAVFTQALTYKGNENPIKDGAELYDLIADADLGGVAGFNKILAGIARESGLLTENEKNAIEQQAENAVTEAFGGNPESLRTSNT